MKLPTSLRGRRIRDKGQQQTIGKMKKTGTAGAALECHLIYIQYMLSARSRFSQFAGKLIKLRYKATALLLVPLQQQFVLPNHSISLLGALSYFALQFIKSCNQPMTKQCQGFPKKQVTLLAECKATS